MTRTEALGVAAGIVLDMRAPRLAWFYLDACGGLTSLSVLVDSKVARMEHMAMPGKPRGTPDEVAVGCPCPSGRDGSDRLTTRVTRVTIAALDSSASPLYIHVNRRP
jgi:hypothetical protein